MTPPDDNSLTLESKAEARLQRFVEQYIVDRNGTRAYLEAYGRQTADGRDRSKHAASVEACRLLKRLDVRREIRAAEAHLRRRSEVSADRIYSELAAIAFSDFADVVDFTGDGQPRPKAARDIPFKARKAIQSMKVQTRKEPTLNGDAEVVTVEYKFHSKIAALEKLYAHLGMSAEANQLDSLLGALPDGLRKQVLAVLDRTTTPGGDLAGETSESNQPDAPTG